MSGLIPQSQVDDANAKIVEVISSRIDLKPQGRELLAVCPFHGSKSRKLSVNEDKGVYLCRSCGATGNAVTFVMNYENIGFRQAVESINGQITLEANSAPRAPVIRAVKCSLPNHAEDREKAASVIARCQSNPRHPYFLRNNTANVGSALSLNGVLMVPLVNNIGETTNVAAIGAKGIKYAAGSPSFGSTAILEPATEPDGKTIICADYAYAWRLWWSQGGHSRVLCTMESGNLSWMLANCKERFTHIGCDLADADEHIEFGRAVILLPLDPYARVDSHPLTA